MKLSVWNCFDTFLLLISFNLTNKLTRAVWPLFRRTLLVWQDGKLLPFSSRTIIYKSRIVLEVKVILAHYSTAFIAANVETRQGSIFRGRVQLTGFAWKENNNIKTTFGLGKKLQGTHFVSSRHCSEGFFSLGGGGGGGGGGGVIQLFTLQNTHTIPNSNSNLEGHPNRPFSKMAVENSNKLKFKKKRIPVLQRALLL